MLPKKLQKKLDDRQENGSLRSLSSMTDLIDFSSNDYLGYASAKTLKDHTQSILDDYEIKSQGATGSRLLSGNHKLYEVAERIVSNFHESESALIFNSGYDANIGFFQSVPQRGDLIIYDEYAHASIRDGIQMSLARGYKFKHNNLTDLNKVLKRLSEMYHLEDRSDDCCVYVVTESVFSMDGDSPDLKALIDICTSLKAHLIVDEAHAIGVIGNEGQGLVQSLELQEAVFARIVTFGKALGSHGAAILGSTLLRQYLLNYARSFIYTTGLSTHTVAMTIAGYKKLIAQEGIGSLSSEVEKLHSLIAYFNYQLRSTGLDSIFINSDSAIHCAIIEGNKRVKEISKALQNKGYDVRAILSPTVPKGQERLRICLHSHNTNEQIDSLLSALKESLL